MATYSQIPIDEYLSTSYRPDCEFIDGELVERNLGDWKHARVQSLLVMWFATHEEAWHTLTALGWRTRVSGTRVRIPDVVLVRTGVQPDVLSDPPVLIVEILSPDDSYSDTQNRAQDYVQMGVETIWIIDPQTRTARVCSGNTWTQATRLEVSKTPIYVDVKALFASLDQVKK